MRQLFLAALLVAFAAGTGHAQESAADLAARIVDKLDPGDMEFHLGPEGETLGIATFANSPTPPPPEKVAALIETSEAPTLDLVINFSFGSSALTEKARAALDAMAIAMQADRLAAYDFLVAGHTDAKGSDAFNRELSVQRAEAVVAYLALHGHVDIRRLQPYGFGESDLKDPADPEGEVNRRVQFVTMQHARASN